MGLSERERERERQGVQEGRWERERDQRGEEGTGRREEEGKESRATAEAEVAAFGGAKSVGEGLPWWCSG